MLNSRYSDAFTVCRTNTRKYTSDSTRKIAMNMAEIRLRMSPA